jgi:WD40 repeat protein
MLSILSPWMTRAHAAPQSGAHELLGPTQLAWDVLPASTSSGNAGACVLSPDGTRLYAAGVSDLQRTLWAFDSSTGAPLWEASISGPLAWIYGDEQLLLSPDGTRLYLAANSDSGTDYDIRAWAFEASTGGEQWSVTWNAALLDDTVRDLALSPDGSRLHVAGLSVRPVTKSDWIVSRGAPGARERHAVRRSILLA